MKYVSTRNKKGKALTSAEAILQGLAKDGGLLVPENIPQIKIEEIKNLKNMRYEDRAVEILKKYLTDYTEEELKESAELAYNYFDITDRMRLAIKSDKPAEAKKIEPEKNKVTAFIELWHGPTSAFKDMALQILPHLMRIGLKKTGEERDILILTATSGDTGKAALSGFADAERTKIAVFYPSEGVSEIQKLQMITQTGKNVKVIGVKGNFDDCQNGVKKIFSDEEIKKKLDAQKIKLSSANSINWGRLVPQIVYYFSAYADLLDNEEINAGDLVNITVPTGNFGNILAAYYAKRMGLPVEKLICASNINHVLTDFFESGIYDRNRTFFRSISPSMDILISSNLERLLYHESGEDSEYIKKLMNELNASGKYEINKDLKKKLKKIFYAEYAGEEETKTTIREMYNDMKYLIDTHTAVGLTVARKYQKKTGDKKPMLIASKFRLKA